MYRKKIFVKNAILLPITLLIFPACVSAAQNLCGLLIKPTSQTYLFYDKFGGWEFSGSAVKTLEKIKNKSLFTCNCISTDTLETQPGVIYNIFNIQQKKFENCLNDKSIGIRKTLSVNSDKFPKQPDGSIYISENIYPGSSQNENRVIIKNNGNITTYAFLNSGNYNYESYKKFKCIEDSNKHTALCDQFDAGGGDVTSEHTYRVSLDGEYSENGKQIYYENGKIERIINISDDGKEQCIYDRYPDTIVMYGVRIKTKNKNNCE